MSIKQQQISFLLLFFACVLFVLSIETLLVAAQRVGESCDGGNGECKEIQYCTDIVSRLTTIEKVDFCNADAGIVCCPVIIPDIISPRFGEDEPKNDAEKACLEYSRMAPTSCPQPLIYGGKKAKARQFQSIALLGTRDKRANTVSWFCGGTLISERFVMTAAHCWTRDINAVRLGELDYSTTSDNTQTQDFEVLNAIVHPSYNFERYNDIGLIELDRAAVFNEFVLPACLPSKQDTYTEFTAVGWGQTNESLASPHLLQVQVQIFSDRECNLSTPVMENLENGLHQRTQICAGSRVSNADTCKGDSGGPLYVAHPSYNCMLQVAAITSFGYIKCGTAGIPSVNTKVNLYLDWIQSIVWNPKVGLGK